MSSRHLRRLENELAFASAAGEDTGLPEGIDEAQLGIQPPPRQNKKKNKPKPSFEMLMMDNEDEDEDGDEGLQQPQDEDNAVGAQNDQHLDEENIPESGVNPKRSNKAKKKKNSKKKDARSDRDQPTNREDSKNAEANDDDENALLNEFIERAQLERVEALRPSVAASGVQPKNSKFLNVQYKAAAYCIPDVSKIDPEAELRNLFGRAAVQAVNQELGDRRGLRGLLEQFQLQRQQQPMSRSQYNQQQQRMAQAARLRSVLVSRTPSDRLIKPKPEWGRIETDVGFQIVPLGSSDGDNKWFCFEYNDEYVGVQALYHDCVESHDPNALVQLLSKCPCHLDTLLQLAQIARQTNDSDLAQELLEMALYAIESNLPASFSWSSGTCHMSFEQDVNRSLFRALFNYIQCLGRRGANVSAFECCKLLLGLDPLNDPMNVLLIYDYYALRVHAYQGLIGLVEEFPYRDLGVMPNIAFSRALAAFLSRTPQTEPSGESHANDEQNQSDAGVAFNQTLCDEWLGQALAMFPSLLRVLLDKINQRSNSVWQDILNQPPFNAQSSHSDTVDHLISLYVMRCHTLWRDQQVVDWLRARCNAVVVEFKNPSSELHSYATAIKEEFPAGPNQLAFIRTDEYANDTAFSVPDEYAPAFNFPRRRERGQMQDEGDVLEAGANPLFLFLRSFLPWTVAPQANAQNEE